MLNKTNNKDDDDICVLSFMHRIKIVVDKVSAWPWWALHEPRRCKNIHEVKHVKISI